MQYSTDNTDDLIENIEKGNIDIDEIINDIDNYDIDDVVDYIN